MFKTVKLLIAVVLAALVTVAVAPSAADARDIRTDAVILFCGAEEGTPRSETLISAFGTAKAPAHVTWGGELRANRGDAEGERVFRGRDRPSSVGRL